MNVHRLILSVNGQLSCHRPLRMIDGMTLPTRMLQTFSITQKVNRRNLNVSQPGSHHLRGGPLRQLQRTSNSIHEILPLRLRRTINVKTGHHTIHGSGRVLIHILRGPDRSTQIQLNELTPRIETLGPVQMRPRTETKILHRGRIGIISQRNTEGTVTVTLTLLMRQGRQVMLPANLCTVCLISTVKGITRLITKRSSGMITQLLYLSHRIVQTRNLRALIGRRSKVVRPERLVFPISIHRNGTLPLTLGTCT